jgi:hypothetical protein
MLTYLTRTSWVLARSFASKTKGTKLKAKPSGVEKTLEEVEPASTKKLSKKALAKAEEEKIKEKIALIKDDITERFISNLNDLLMPAQLHSTHLVT